ncbi:MAG: hypothetical protein AAGF11_37570 [Myxococcota bacterium]
MPEFEKWLWATSYAEYFTGMTGEQFGQLRLHLYDVVSGEAGPLPDDLPRCVPLEVFDPSSVRSLLLMHMLARRLHAQGDERPPEGARLMALGAAAFGRLYPELPVNDPANRILVDPVHGVEVRRILRDRTHPRSPSLRHAHVLPPWEERSSTTPQTELDWRRQRLAEMEKTEFQRLGLVLDTDPPRSSRHG